MKPSTITMLRAYLMTASLAATGIDAAAFLSMSLFGVPEDVFLSMTFRAAALGAIVCVVLATRRVARAAFASALSHQYATFTDGHANTIAVSPTCPVRMLVILHLRFNRTAIEWSKC